MGTIYHFRRGKKSSFANMQNLAFALEAAAIDKKVGKIHPIKIVQGLTEYDISSDFLDESDILGASFPEGSRLYQVGSHSIFCFHTRCVIVAEEDQQVMLIGEVIKQLTTSL